MYRLLLTAALVVASYNIHAQPAAFVGDATTAPGLTVVVPFGFVNDGTVFAAQADMVFDGARIVPGSPSIIARCGTSPDVLIICGIESPNIIRWRTVSLMPPTSPLPDGRLGVFTLDVIGIDPASITLQIINEFFTDANGNLVPGSGAADGLITINPAPATVLTGVISDGCQGQILEGAQISTSSGFDIYSGLGGVYTTLDSPGDHTAIVSLAGYDDQPFSYSLLVDQSTTVDVTLAPIGPCVIFENGFENLGM